MSSVTAPPAPTHTQDLVRCVSALERMTLHDRPHTDAMIWQRELPSSVQRALEHLPTQPLADGRFRITPDQAAQKLHETFHDWAFDAGEAAGWLAADVDAMARHMAQLLNVNELLLRVELVRDDACRKFHRDTINARLICTYAGPGTEYGVAQSPDALDRPQTVPTGCPILLKGKLWPEGPDHPGRSASRVFHRSPPIAGTGQTRLVMVINEANPKQVTHRL